MKKLKIINIVVLLLLIFIGFSSCDEDVNDKKWGYSKIYMPQAVMLNGGISNIYPVPMINNSGAKNYMIDTINNTLKITLGVYRSGLQKLESYSVKVSVNSDSTNSLVNQTIKGISLPDDTYSLPEMVSVKDGERQAFFYLNVDLNLLKSKYVNYANKKLCLVVEISDPSKYELNEALSKTKVIINASAFMPTPVILTGGEFDDSSVPFWSKTSIDGTTPTLENALKIENGNLIIDFGTGNVTRSVAISHPVELEMGLTYKFSAAASWTGATSAELFFILSTVKPTSSMGYNKTNNYFTALDVWLPAPNFSTSGSGIFPQVGKYEKGINRSTGEFTANFTQGYVVVLATCWGGNVGLVTIDRIKIEEL